MKREKSSMGRLELVKKMVFRRVMQMQKPVRLEMKMKSQAQSSKSGRVSRRESIRNTSTSPQALTMGERVTSEVGNVLGLLPQIFFIPTLVTLVLRSKEGLLRQTARALRIHFWVSEDRLLGNGKWGSIEECVKVGPLE